MHEALQIEVLAVVDVTDHLLAMVDGYDEKIDATLTITPRPWPTITFPAAWRTGTTP